MQASPSFGECVNLLAARYHAQDFANTCMTSIAGLRFFSDVFFYQRLKLARQRRLVRALFLLNRIDT